MSEVTDPELLKQLNAPDPTPSTRVTDPALLAQLNEDPNRSVGDRIWGLTKAAGQGVLDAGTGLLGLPGDVLPHVKSGVNLAGRDALENMLRSAGVHYDPQNLGERYVRAGTEGIASTLGPGMPWKAGMILGGLSGVGQEVGKALFEDPQTGGHLGQTIGSAAVPGAFLGGPTVVNELLPNFLKNGLTERIGRLKPTWGMFAEIARSLLQQNLHNYPAAKPPPPSLTQQADTLAQ